MRCLTASAVLVAVLAGTGCGPTKGGSADVRDTAALAARLERFTERLRQPTDSGASREVPLARWLLPQPLSEISGLALTSDGRLLANNDESAMVFEIDYRRGVVVKQFTVGKQSLHEDFEAMTIAGERIFMLASNGKVYEFREGKDGDEVDFVVHDTKLGRECEFEGVAFDSAANSLVLACKKVGTKGLKEFMVLYRWTIGDSSGSLASEIKVPLSEVIGANDWKKFNPSDMTRDPITGGYVIIASLEKGLLSLAPGGAVLLSRPLPDGHPMAEGVAITRDSILIISDEASGTPAAITLYRWP